MKVFLIIPLLLGMVVALVFILGEVEPFSAGKFILIKAMGIGLMAFCVYQFKRLFKNKW